MYYADGFYPADNFFDINATTGDISVMQNLMLDTIAREDYEVMQIVRVLISCICGTMCG